jgi:hypothetical protein
MHPTRSLDVSTPSEQPLSDFLLGFTVIGKSEPVRILLSVCPTLRIERVRSRRVARIPVDSGTEQESTLALGKAHPVRYFAKTRANHSEKIYEDIGPS